MTPHTPSPEISVVLCTYNGEKYLREQLESILAQTALPKEIVISDDGSSDGTLALIDAIKREHKDRNVRWVVKKRTNPIGPAQNFWSAIPHATSELIALADQDDVWYPTKLERLSRYFEGNQFVLLAHSDADIVDGEGNVIGGLFDSLRLTPRERNFLTKARGLEALARRNLVTGMTVMMRQTLFPLAGSLPEGWVHDEWLAFVAAAHGGLRTDTSRLVAYRQHGLNSIGAHKISLKSALHRLFASREPYLSYKTQRARQIERFLEMTGRGISFQYRDLIQGKIEFLRWQASLPKNHVRRVPAVLARLFAGSYAKYARGLFDAVRDLIIR